MKTIVPVCPHCRTEQTDDAMYEADADIYALAPNESIDKMKCYRCEKTFWVRGGYIPQYETFKTEEDAEIY